MRIRTVKPEFWAHPILSAQADEVRLGALGLLNVADDHGYFLANPAAVRSALWPLDEDSTKARRVLAQLSQVGYIDVREHPTHGAVGWVVNFTKHQRVDRPSPSRIAHYHDSSSVRRVIDDRSLLDQGSGIKGSRDQGNEGSALAPIDEHDLLAPSSVDPKAPVSDRDHWRMHESSQPWARNLKAIAAKIGPENWLAWQTLVAANGLPRLLAAIKALPAGDRWPDATEAALAAGGGQLTAGEAVRHKTIKITL